VVTFLALYRGDTITDARLVATSANPALVADVASRMLCSPAPGDDPVLDAVERGRRRALRMIRAETANAVPV
jgi:hypothetical protein